MKKENERQFSSEEIKCNCICHSVEKKKQFFILNLQLSIFFLRKERVLPRFQRQENAAASIWNADSTNNFIRLCFNQRDKKQQNSYLRLCTRCRFTANRNKD